MANKRTRDRQLAKLAARRQAQRRAQRRKRNAALAVGVVVALVAVAAGFFTLTAGDDRPARARASGTPSPTPSAGVACGAKAPKAAGRAKPTFSKPPRMTIDPATTYTAAVETSCGAIAVRLDAERAPETVNSFVFLANEGFYDGLTFHRIANSIDVIQGGDPSGNGTGGPGYSLDDELTGRERYTTGTVAMANSGPDTAGSQFFIVTGPKASSLPKDYTVFGEVVRGLDTARRIQGLPVNGETPARTVYIDEVTISER